MVYQNLFSPHIPPQSRILLPMSISAFNDLFSEIANPDEKTLQQGELLFEQGDLATHIFVVKITIFIKSFLVIL